MLGLEYPKELLGANCLLLSYLDRDAMGLLGHSVFRHSLWPRNHSDEHGHSGARCNSYV